MKTKEEAQQELVNQQSRLLEAYAKKDECEKTIKEATAITLTLQWALKESEKKADA